MRNPPEGWKYGVAALAPEAQVAWVNGQVEHLVASRDRHKRANENHQTELAALQARVAKLKSQVYDAAYFLELSHSGPAREEIALMLHSALADFEEKA